MPAVRVWLLQRVIECWQDREFAGVGRQHCWGAPLLRRGRVPCMLLDERLPPDPQGASRSEWDAYLTAAARETLVTVCPVCGGGATMPGTVAVLSRPRLRFSDDLPMGDATCAACCSLSVSRWTISWQLENRICGSFDSARAMIF